MVKDVRAEVKDSVEWSDASPAPSREELMRDVFMERWGPYTGSSQPEMLGGAENVPSFEAIDPSKARTPGELG
jgi:hypothetical protein